MLPRQVRRLFQSAMKGIVHDRLRHIEGKHNALVKELRAAFSRPEPTTPGVCAIEGFRIVEEAIRSGIRIEAVFFSESAENKAERLLPQLGSHVETLLLPDKLFSSAVPSDSPQGVAAMLRLKEHSAEDIIRRVQSGVLVGVVGLQDPGNLGTIVRSAEAFGGAGIFIGEDSVTPFNPKVIRASAGSLFRLPFARAKTGELIPQLKAAGVRVMATSSHKGTVLREVDLRGPTAVFIGAEGSGLPRNLTAVMDETIVIPHAMQVESLNAGMAASIVLYEAARQRSQSI
jgi:RNA methyltransferase, TrmH family